MQNQGYIEAKEFYQEKVKNDAKSPLICYDCFGNSILIEPGKTVLVMRVKKRLEAVKIEEDTPDVLEGSRHEPNHSRASGQDKEGSGKSKD
jgi:hypothetical protein